MTTENTFCIIKPDATSRNITGSINKMIEEAKFEILAQKIIKLTSQQAIEFYIEHKDRPFFKSLVNYMISENIVVQVLRGKDAVTKFREVIGATNPRDADEGTIRKTFGISIDHNTIHGSDSHESARREINFFFPTYEIIQLTENR